MRSSETQEFESKFQIVAARQNSVCKKFGE
jgi:hypothetical protein